LVLALLAAGTGVCLKVIGVNVWRLGAARQSQPRGSDRDGRWATPIERAGLPNLHKVSDDLYRGAQPTAEGMAELKAMGVRTIVNLRSFHSDRDEIGELGLGYEHITMKPWHAEEKEVVRFLQIVADPSRTPVFVHCKRGADRTGTMCAVYRVVAQGWTKEQAVREMTEGGYGYWDGWEDLVEFLETLDADDIRRRVEGTD
jgi:protein tyrosine/serine phosphatase